MQSPYHEARLMIDQSLQCWASVYKQCIEWAICNGDQTWSIWI